MSRLSWKIYTALILFSGWITPALADYGEDTTAKTAGGLIDLSGTASQTVASLAGKIVGTLLAFLGTLFLVMIIVGGFLWMTAAGNQAKAKTAGKLITYAVIGLIIILSAYAIVTFVGDSIPK